MSKRTRAQPPPAVTVLQSGIAVSATPNYPMPAGVDSSAASTGSTTDSMGDNDLMSQQPRNLSDEQRRVRRMIQNRKAAQDSRLRKRKHVDELRDQYTLLNRQFEAQADYCTLLEKTLRDHNIPLPQRPMSIAAPLQINPIASSVAAAAAASAATGAGVSSSAVSNVGLSRASATNGFHPAQTTTGHSLKQTLPPTVSASSSAISNNSSNSSGSLNTNTSVLTASGQHKPDLSLAPTTSNGRAPRVTALPTGMPAPGASNIFPPVRPVASSTTSTRPTDTTLVGLSSTGPSAVAIAK